MFAQMKKFVKTPDTQDSQSVRYSARKGIDVNVSVNMTAHRIFHQTCWLRVHYIKTLMFLYKV